MTKGAGVTVIGGGMAGASAAFHLAKSGRAVDLFEAKTQAHHKVCGEFLSAEGFDLLSEIIPDQLTKWKPPIIDRALFTCGKAEVAFDLPQKCYGLSRHKIDEAMLDAAQTAGACLHRGQHINDLPEGKVVLATGKREHPLSKRALTGSETMMVGLKAHLKMRDSFPEKLKGLIHLFFYKGGYGGLMEIEDGLVSLALAVNKATMAAHGNQAQAQLEAIAQTDPSLNGWLEHCEPATNALAVGRVPYGYLHKPDTKARADLYRVGDQAAVIPSYSGDGMSMALASGKWAAQAIARDQVATSFHQSLEKALRPNLRNATLMGPLIARPRLLSAIFKTGHVTGLAKLLGPKLFHLTRTRV